MPPTKQQQQRSPLPSSPSSFSPSPFTPSPPPVPSVRLALPRPHVLLVTLDRPAALNAVTRAQHRALARLWDWYDAEPSLRCAVLTGAGRRAFCAGADLKEWDAALSGARGEYGDGGADGGADGGGGGDVSGDDGGDNGDGGDRGDRGGGGGGEIIQDGTGQRGPAVTTTTNTETTTTRRRQQQQQQKQRQGRRRRRGPTLPPSGFGGLSNRGGKKPVIAAVAGLCLGGGMEMALGCDLVVASRARAAFALPEARIGVIAVAGALPRLARAVGRHRAMEMALVASAGRGYYTAAEMRDWGIVNEVVDDDDDEDDEDDDNEEGEGEGDGEDGSKGKRKGKRKGKKYGAVVEAGLRWAEDIASNSPDAVIASREGIKLGWEGVNPEVATDLLAKGWYARIEGGENMVEGVRSFVEKRKPVWKNSKL